MMLASEVNPVNRPTEAKPGVSEPACGVLDAAVGGVLIWTSTLRSLGTYRESRDPGRSVLAAIRAGLSAVIVKRSGEATGGSSVTG